MPELAVFGEWDASNLGDRAIHENVLRFCAEHGWDAASYSIGALVPVTPRGARAASARRGAGTVFRAVPPLKRTLRALRQRRRIARLLEPLARADAILVGGGQLLTDRNLHFPQSLARIAWAARRLGKPLWCLGCGTEGSWSPHGESLVRGFLQACDVVAVRDDETAACVGRALGREVPVFGDFCLATPAGAAPPGQSLALNVQQLAPPWAVAQQHYESALAALAGRIARAAGGAHALRVFTTGAPEDAAAARRLHARLRERGAQLTLPASLDELHAVLDASALVLASRLHAGVLALARGRAVLGFSPQPKLRHYLATLGLGEDGFAPDAADAVLQRLERDGPGGIARAQRERLPRAAQWSCRAEVGEYLESLAQRAGACS